MIEGQIVEAEEDHEHRPRGEWKHAQGEQVDEKLFRSDRAHLAGADGRLDLLPQLVHDARADVFGRRAGQRRDQLADPLGMMVQLAEDVAGQSGVRER